MLHECSKIKKTTNLYCLRSVQSPPSLESRLYTYKVPSADATRRRKTFWILKKQQGNTAVKNNSITISTCRHTQIIILSVHLSLVKETQTLLAGLFWNALLLQRNPNFISRTVLKCLTLTKIYALGSCDHASWAKYEDRKTNKMQQLHVYY